MKRVIFDTNIYGNVIEAGEVSVIEKNIENVLVNYGSVIVRRELRGYEGKRTVFHEGKVRKFRALLLEAYDVLVKKTYEVDEKTDRLAEEYFLTYKKLGGAKLRDEITNDFLIVATAVIHDLEVIYTEEKEGSAKEGGTKTMRSPEALKAYEIVNELNGFKSPEFRSYEELKSDLRVKRWSA